MNVTVIVSPALAKPVVGDVTVTPDRSGALLVIETTNEELAVLPAESVAEHVTVVSPIAKVEPEAGEHDTVRFAGFTSVAEGVLNEITLPAAEVASSVTAADEATDGAVTSTTGPVPVSVTVLPLKSNPEMLYDVAPSGELPLIVTVAV